MIIICFSFFFFSSRRRHTRYWRDWSSDVCSSDLTGRRGRGWAFPLVAGAWDDPVVDSPSVQLWVPPAGDGLPVVEGVFSQVRSEERRVGKECRSRWSRGK